MDHSALRRASRARLATFGQRHEGTKRSRRGLVLVVLALLIAAGTQCVVPTPAQRRVDLVVLILNDGTTPGVAAVRDELKAEGVPTREVNLADPARPVIDAAFLSTTSGTNPVIERARYQAVVGADENLTGLTAAERAAVIAYEVTFGIRHVTAGTWANPAVGLNYAQNPGYIGSLDSMTATVTPAGQAAPFSYLAGPIPFEAGSYGYLATPVGAPPAGATYTPLITVPIPGTTSAGSIVGTYAHDGRDELVITASFNSFQQQFRAMGRGLVTWMTKGVHLGHARSYLTVHVDDLYASDSRWNSTANCTPGEDCPPSVVAGPDIRMTAADLQATVAWQQANGFAFDWAYNGFGSDSWVEDHGSDPLLTASKASRASFGWINHTYTHEFLGCQQDFTVIPWRCRTDAAGQTLYVSQAAITDEINRNKAFATAHGLPINPAELVTGEHSGLYILPQQPNDNPNLASALAATGVANIAADNSRQPDTRLIGSSRTVPRHPMLNYFNVGTKAEMADEFNWLQTSVADGGSGACIEPPAEPGQPGFLCREPVDIATGYDNDIVPLDTGITLQHMLGNDPRPHYVHQSNLAEERILLPLMSSVLGRYRSMFNATVPPVHVTQTQAATLLARQSDWAAGSSQVEAYTLGNTLYVCPTASSPTATTCSSPSNTGAYTGAVPITVPNGTSVDVAGGVAFGEPYAGESSAWVAVNGIYRLVLPTGA